VAGCCSSFGAVGVLVLAALAFFLEANPLSHPGADMFKGKHGDPGVRCPPAELWKQAEGPSDAAHENWPPLLCPTLYDGARWVSNPAPLLLESGCPGQVFDPFLP